MPAFNSIFRKNGLKTSDKKLVDLAKPMGGTAIEIWECREYWGEVETMALLRKRIGKETFMARCSARSNRT